MPDLSAPKPSQSFNSTELRAYGRFWVSWDAWPDAEDSQRLTKPDARQAHRALVHWPGMAERYLLARLGHDGVARWSFVPDKLPARAL
jgi:hypothetical protein